MSPDDLATIVVDTAAAVRKASLEEAWSLEAFKVALGAQLTVALSGTPTQEAGRRSLDGHAVAYGPPSSHKAQQDGEDAGPLAQLRRQLRLDELDISDVFTVSQGRLEVHVPRSLLPKSKSGASKDLALLICAADQAIGNEWTSVETIRKVVHDYGAYDSSNFTGSLGALDTSATSRGKLAAREYRLTRGGWEHAATIVRRLVEATR
jgi:hypothetical protein